MNPNQTISRTLEVLAPYLPYGIEVAVDYADGHAVERGILLGIVLGGRCMKGRSGYVEFPDGMSRWVDLTTFRPILRPFSALCDPLPDGTVPAQVVGNLMLSGRRDRSDVTYQYIDDDDPTYAYILFSSDSHDELLHLTDFYAANGGITGQICDYLRRNQFAVGLTADQFIAK